MSVLDDRKASTMAISDLLAGDLIDHDSGSLGLIVCTEVNSADARLTDLLVLYSTADGFELLTHSLRSWINFDSLWGWRTVIRLGEVIFVSRGPKTPFQSWPAHC